MDQLWLKYFVLGQMDGWKQEVNQHTENSICFLQIFFESFPWNGSKKAWSSIFSDLQFHCADFNCIQSGHQIILEQQPQCYLLLTFGGLSNSKLTAAGAWIWMAGRIVYAEGYSIGDPKSLIYITWEKRVRAFGYLGLLIML